MKKFTFRVLIFACSFLLIGNVQAQDVIDLTGIDNADILVDTLPDIISGAVVLLEPGMTYNAGGYAFDKSVTIKSSEPNNLMLPKIDCSSNYNFADGAMVDSIVFMNVEFFYTDFNDKYVVNSNVGATIGKFMFDGCYIHDLRGVLRMKDNGPGSLETYAINNCVITRIRDYGILTVDVNTWMVNNILITNSTISKARAFLTSKNNTDMLLIDGCTINEVPSAGQRLFRWRESGQDNVTGGIMIKNTLWGPGWDEESTGSTGYDGFDGLGDTEWTLENTFVTSDVMFADGKDTITAFLDNAIDDAASDLWTYPSEGEFNYYDMNFDEIGTAGDQRWAMATADGGREWNISDTAFNTLGEVTMTKTVAGLTIFAHEGKTVTIDDNGKTLDDMVFTQRLKLGGSGDFDDMGQPLGRVLSIDVNGNSNITVAAMSSSSSSDRVLNISAGIKDNVIAEFPAMGAELTKGEYYYQGGPTKLYFYSPSSGVNIYYLKAAMVPTVVDKFEIDKSNVNIYPNPANNRVYVDINRPMQVAIYNIAGSMLKSKMIQSKDDYINISDLQSGMYLIRSQFDNTFAKKLIKR